MAWFGERALPKPHPTPTETHRKCYKVSRGFAATAPPCASVAQFKARELSIDCPIVELQIVHSGASWGT